MLIAARGLPEEEGSEQWKTRLPARAKNPVQYQGRDGDETEVRRYPTLTPTSEGGG